MSLPGSRPLVLGVQNHPIRPCVLSPPTNSFVLLSALMAIQKGPTKLPSVLNLSCADGFMMTSKDLTGRPIRFGSDGDDLRQGLIRRVAVLKVGVGLIPCHSTTVRVGPALHDNIPGIISTHRSLDQVGTDFGD